MKNFNVDSLLYSDQSNQKFENCSVCGETINNKTFIIEKAYKKNYIDNELITVFELAVCDDCRLQMNEDISKESKENIQEFVTEKTNFIEDHFDEAVQTLKNYQNEARCMITGKLIADCDEFQVVLIHQKSGFNPKIPMFVSDEAIELYQELLSNHTKGFFDDFMDNLHDVPPGLEDLLNPKKSPVFL